MLPAPALDGDHAAELHASACAALEGGYLDDALILVVLATAHVIAASGVDHPDVARCDLLRARIARAQGAHDDALDFAAGAIETLDAARDVYPDEPALVAMRAGAAAIQCAALVALGRHDDARRAVTQVLPLTVAVCGANADVVADLHRALGSCHAHQGRWTDAAAQYARAGAILVALHGDDSPALAALEHDLGQLAHARGQTAVAEPHARRAIELRRRAVGDDHPAVAADLVAWAAMLEALGRTDDAAVAYSEALAIFHATLGPDHVEVASTRGAIGALFAGARRAS